MEENGKNMAGNSLNRAIKKPSSPMQEGQKPSDMGQGAQMQQPNQQVDQTQAELAQNSLNAQQPQIPDFSYMDSFAEAFRQAKALGTTQFRWKPDRFGNDTYATGIQDVKGGQAVQEPQGPETVQNNQANPKNMDEPTGEESTGQQQKKPGIISRMANKIMGK